MQFVLGSPKSVLMAPSKNEGWREFGWHPAIKHPVVLTVGCFFFAVLFLWIINETGFVFDAGMLLKPAAMAAFLGVILLITVPHELLHAVAFPDRGGSPLSSVGFWPKKLAFYASYNGAQPRNRAIFSTFLPFAALTIFPFVLAAGFDFAPAVMYAIAFANGLASLWDLVLVFSLLAFVPRDSDVILGDKIYWKAAG